MPYVVKLACVIFALQELGGAESVAVFEAFLARIGGKVKEFKKTFYQDETLAKWQNLCLSLCLDYSVYNLTTFVYKVTNSTDLL